MEKEPCGTLVRFLKVLKLQSFEFSVSNVIPANVQNISPLISFQFFQIKFFDVFDHFSQTHEVAKFQMNRLYLNVCDIIHANEHTTHANCEPLELFGNAILFDDEKESF